MYARDTSLDRHESKLKCQWLAEASNRNAVILDKKKKDIERYSHPLMPMCNTFKVEMTMELYC